MNRMSEPLWIALWCTRLPLEALETCGETERNSALVVCEHRRVVRASAAALEAGIEPGMRAATARALCDRLRVRERDPVAEETRLRELAGHMLCITPASSLRPPDGVLLEAGGCLRLFGGLSPLLDALHKALRPSRLTLHTALGPTPEAAWQFTRLAPEDSLSLFPGGRFHREAFLTVLEQFPLEALDLEPKLLRQLLRPGFRTLGELLALPRATLGRRFGRAFPQWLETLTGERPDPRLAIGPAERFRREREFADPVAHSDALLRPMEELLEELMAFLHRRQQYTAALRWHLRGHQSAAQTLVIRRAHPDRDIQRWMLLVRRRLEHFRLRAPVLRLGLECATPRAAHPHSATLLGEPNARPDADGLLEELATLPGLHCLCPGHPGGHLPESPQGEPPEHPSGGPRPLWLLEQPRPLTQQDQQPCWKGQPLELLPEEERLSGDWWQQPARRRYRFARHPRGWYCWVFREKGQWWLQGIF